MEWAKETAASAYEALPGSETASKLLNKASEYVGPTEGNGSATTTASIINTPPFSSFKPDSSIVWIGNLIYVILAAGCTIPWWTLVTAADNFLCLYPGWHVIRYFTLTYFVSWLITYMFVIKFGRQATAWVKINVGLSIAVLALVLISLIDGVFIKGSEGTRATFWATLAVVAMAGAGSAVAEGSLLGIAAELPESFTRAYVSGAAVSGALAFIVRVITKASFNSSPSGLRIGGIVYFSVIVVFLVLVMVLFAYIHYMPQMSYYNSLNLGSFETIRLLLQDEDSVSPEVAAGAAIAAVAAGRYSPTQPLNWKPAWNRIKLLATSAFITTLTTVSVFPGYSTEDVSSNHFGGWFPVLLVGTYAFFDLAGRGLTTDTTPERHSGLFGAAWARILLLGFFLLARVGPRCGLTYMLFLLTAMLGFSHGYLIAALTIMIPRANPANEAETAGILHAAIMITGTIVGAGLSWLWVPLS